METEKLLRECESLLRSGQDARVAQLLSKLNIARLPRKWRRPLANVCRRASLLTTGLRILGPVVRDETASLVGEKPSSDEISEYAVLLQRTGAVHEAIELLAGVDAKTTPNANLYRAFCHFNIWEHEEAIPYLRAYLVDVQEPYQRIVGSVNLGAALVTTGDLRAAKPLLQETAEAALESGYARLRGNCLELLAQAHLQQRELHEAERCLLGAEQVFTSPQSIERMFIDVYRAYLDALKTGIVDDLKTARSRAVVWPHAETVREIDLLCQTVAFRKPEFDHLYFGTPYRSYRNRLARLIQREPASMVYHYGPEASPVFDLATGKISDGRECEPGSIVHQTLEVLLRDFYRPLPTATLFAALYPGEFFNVTSSPVRVRQVVHRARRWLGEQDIPVSITVTQGQHRLNIDGKFAFSLRRERRQLHRNELALDALREQVHGGQFSAEQARQRLGLSASALQRLLAWGQQTGRLEKYGAGPATLYFWLDGQGA